MSNEIKMYKDWLWVVEKQNSKAEKEMEEISKKIQKNSSSKYLERKADLSLILDSYKRIINDVTTIIKRLEHTCEENKK